MDTIQIRVSGLDKFQVMPWAIFVPVFSTRDIGALSLMEKKRSKDKKVPYLRSFVLHPENTGKRTIPSVKIYEAVEKDSERLTYEMTITLSLPKLLFENSLCEITPECKQQVFHRITGRLADAGIQVGASEIATAPVSVVHFCKNIPLPPDISLRSILAVLMRSDMGKAYDNRDDTQLKNKNNKVLHLYSGIRDFVFYDKIEDIKRPKNKAEEKQKTVYEKELLERYELDGIEVFRYEYRLKKAQTIKSELNTLLGRPYQTPILFRDLFSEGLWKSVLLDAWRRILDRSENQLALFNGDNRLELMLRIFKNATENRKDAHSQNRAFWGYGLAMAVGDNGVKTVRQECRKIWSERSDKRLKEKMAKAALWAKGTAHADGITYISKELERFAFITSDLLPDLKKFKLGNTKNL